MPTTEERFRHLILAGTSESRPFTQVNLGGRQGGPRYPNRDAEEHGRFLVNELSAVIGKKPELLSRRQEWRLDGITGLNLSFDLEVNPDLPIDSLEDRKAGIELLAFRPAVDGIGTATVFVPEGKLAVLERKLADYLDPKKTTKSGARRGEALVNSIAQIRKAVLRDLWTDPIHGLPSTGEPCWWEVWTRGLNGIERFREQAARFGIRAGNQELHFVDRSIVLARATVEQMTLSVDLLDSIAELREARSLAFELLDVDFREERTKLDSFRSRIESPPEDSPAVCVLDTGADIGHPLLEAALPRGNAHSYDEANWGVEDRQGHGTEMAGLALFGDTLERQLLETEVVEVRHQLEGLGEAQVRMRVTLSYFIEPKPGQRKGPGGIGRRYRYASHGLRFAVKTAREDEREFLGKINKADRTEGEELDADRDTEEWLIGRARDHGSIHSDVWTGTAADLAAKDSIAVFPVMGWWRDARSKERVERRARYALVVSIESDAAEIEIAGAQVPIDFYAEILNRIEIEGIQILS